MHTVMVSILETRRQGTTVPSDIYVSSDCTTCSCLLQSDTTECTTLAHVLNTLIRSGVSGTQHIFIKGNYSSDETEEIALPTVLLGKKKLAVSCTKPDSLKVKLTIKSAKYQRFCSIEFRNCEIMNSVVAVQNFQLVFYNVNFWNSRICDLSPELGTFGEIEIRFENVSLVGSRQDEFGLVLTKTFVLSCFFVQTHFVEFKANLSVSSLLVFFRNSVVSGGQMDFSAGDTVLYTVESCEFSALLNLSVRARKIWSKFTGTRAQNCTGITVRKEDSGFLDSWIEMDVRNSTFRQNTKFGCGGALELLLHLREKQFRPRNLVSITNSLFARNEVTRIGEELSQGGALYIQTNLSASVVNFPVKPGVIVLVRDCTFLNNYAESGGGAVYFPEAAVDISIHRCEFLYTSPRPNLGKGIFILGYSRISVKQSLFAATATASDLSVSLVEVQILTEAVSIRGLQIHVQCRPWYRVEVDKDLVASQRVINTTSLRKLIVLCISCSPSYFTPSTGIAEITYDPLHGEFTTTPRRLSSSTRTEFPSECVKCPVGAECPGDSLTAKPHFWGSISEEGFEFQQCPLGYCCEGNKKSQCIEFNSCSAGREGTLCGSCKESHSLSLMSTSCVQQEKCDDDWIWFVALLACVAYMAWYTFKDILFEHVLKLITFQRTPSAKNTDKGYFGILMYFVQTAALLHLPLQDIKLPSPFLFVKNVEFYTSLLLTFELSSTSVDICPSKKITTIHKMILLFSFMIGTYFSWLVLFVICWTANRMYFQTSVQHKIAWVSLKKTLMGGLIEIMKYTYSSFSDIFFSSMTCVTVADDHVWFLDGSVKCPNYWQLTMCLFGILYIIPFPGALFINLRLKEKAQISNKTFLFGLFLPLPFLLHVCLSSLKANIRGAVFPSVDSNVSVENSKTKESFLYERFRGAYRKSNKGTQYWECVVILRRLLLYSTLLIPNTLVQLSICSFLCALFLIHHNSIGPFAHKSSNQVETLSLFSLTVLSVINLMKACFIFVGLMPEGKAAATMSNFRVLECSLLPVLIVFIVSIELALKRWKCRR